MVETKFYILFSYHTERMRMENILKKQEIKYTIVQTPSELSETCVTSIVYNKKDEGKIKILLEMNSINIAGMIRLSKDRDY